MAKTNVTQAKTATATAKRTAARKVKNQTTDQEMTELGQNDFSAIVTKQEIEKYESTQNEVWGTKRRVAMICLTRSKAQLVDGFGDSPDDILDMIEHIHEWRDHLKCHIEMADTAAARLMVVASSLIYGNDSKSAPSDLTA